MATVRDRRKRGIETGPRWDVQYRDHTGRQRYPSFNIKADADAFKAHVERAAQTGRLDLLDADRKLLGDLGVEYFRTDVAQRAQATQETLRYVWNAHVRDHEIAATPIGAIRPSTIRSYLADLADAGVGESSIRKAHGIVAQVLDSADDILDSNPARRVSRPAPKRVGSVKIATPQQVEAMRGSMGERDAAIVSVLAYAGLRPSELRALTWSHVRGDWLHVEAKANDRGEIVALKSDNPPRDVPICDALASDLDDLGRGAAKAFIFGTSRQRDGGRPVGSVWTKREWDNWRARVFKPALEASGVDIDVPYDLRHSIASLWLRERIDIVQVADWLGNSVQTCARVYAHPIRTLKHTDRRTVDQQIADARSEAS